MRRPTAFLVLCLCGSLAGCAAKMPDHAASVAPPAGFLCRTLPSPHGKLAYVVYIPPALASSTRPVSASLPAGVGQRAGLPLVLFLHGRGECGTDGLRQMIHGIPQRIIREPEKWPAVVLMPQKPDPDKQWIDYEPELLHLIERTCSEFIIDRSRMYLTGLSQGGAGTWALAANHPALFAAIAPVCGYTGDFRKPIAPAEITRIGASIAVAGTPVWAFHGEIDEVVPLERTRELVAAMQAAGGTPRLTIYPGVNHNSWDNAYAEPELAAWLFAQRRSP